MRITFRPISIIVATVYGWLVLAAFPFIFIRLNAYWGLPVYSFLFLKIIGMVIAVIGVSVWLYCIYLFFRVGKGTPIPTDPPQKLVISGIYQYTRNPMYVCTLAVLLGYFLWFGHILLLLYWCLLALFLYFHVAWYEEPALKKKFGNSYLEYIKKVPRWL